MGTGPNSWALGSRPGRVFDFHSLRHQFISNPAAAGAHPKVAQQLATQQLARHSTISVTVDRYTHMHDPDVAGASRQLPDLPSNLLAHRLASPADFRGESLVQRREPESAAKK